MKCHVDRSDLRWLGYMKRMDETCLMKSVFNACVDVVWMMLLMLMQVMVSSEMLYFGWISDIKNGLNKIMSSESSKVVLETGMNGDKLFRGNSDGYLALVSL